MDDTKRLNNPQSSHTLSTSKSGKSDSSRRRIINSELTSTRSSCSSSSSSPEFEFWMLRNPSFPQPNILSADELFLDGVLLPLHLLPTTRLTLKPDPEQLSPPPPPHQQHPEPPTPSSASITASSAAVLSSSKRWKDIFRKSDKKKNSEEEEEKVDEGKKKKKKERKGAGTSSAELNINIWPFSRSRSAGNSGSTRPKVFPSTRKVNSAPCSRSNSGGESKSRKWGSSPGRAGIHLGRSSPVWRGTRKGKGNVMNMNVPVPPMRRRCDDNNTIAGGGSSNNISGEQGNNNNNNYYYYYYYYYKQLFNLRSLFFTKKTTLVTSH